ncbi:MAG: hypothetical protein AAF587_01485 [Bacteroidota bacterium]
MNPIRRSYRFWLVPLVLILSLLLRLDHRYFYPNFYLDTEVQLAAAQSFLLGDGFGYRYTHGPDLGEVQYRSGHIFMPGYAAAVVPAFLLTEDWYLAAYLVDVLSFLLIYLGLIWIWSEIQGERKMLVWMLLLIGISPAPLHYLTASGALAIGLYLLSLAGLLQSARTSNIWMYILSIGLAGLAAITRSAYLPLWLALPIMMGVWGGFMQHSPELKWGIGGGFCTLILIVLVQLLKAGDESFFDSMNQRLYWEHLWAMEPFPFKTFFYYGVPHEVWLQEKSEFLYGILQAVAYGASFLILGGLLVASNSARKSTRSIPKGGRRWLLGIWVIIGINVAMLALLSLRVPSESWNWTGFWTFVMEPRYYMPAMFSLLISVFWLGGQRRWARAKKWIRIFLLIISLAACSYPLYLKFRIHIQGNLSGTFAVDPRPLWAEKIQQLPKDEHSLLVLTSSTNTHIGEMVGAVTLPWEFMQVDSIFSSVPLTLVGLTLPEHTPSEVDTIEMIEGYWWWEKQYPASSGE